MIRVAAGAGAWALALLLVAGPVRAQGVDWRAEAGFSLVLPEGWTVVREAVGRGLAVRAPDGYRWPVELVTWRLSVGVTTAAEAGEEHERIMAGRLEYARRRAERIEATGVGEVMRIEGTVREADGTVIGSVFAVFVTGGRGYVVGTFADPGGEEEAWRTYLQPIIGGLSLGGVPVGAPVSEAAVRPAPEPPAEAPEVIPQPAGPVGAAVAPEDYHHPIGFSLRLPPDWTCEASGHVVRLAGPMEVRAYLLPVVCSAGAMGRLASEEAVWECLAEETKGTKVVLRRAEGDGRGSWFEAELEVEGRARRGLFGYVSEGSRGLLGGVTAPAEALERVAPAAAEVLASFEAGFPAPAAPEAAREGPAWTDASGQLQCHPPEGWALQGGVTLYDGKPAVSVQGSFAGQWFVWWQPLRPVFRELTPPMERLGFRDGDPYYTYEGIDRRMVLTRGAPRDLLTRYLLPRMLLPLRGETAVFEASRAEGVALLGAGDEQAERASLVSGEGEERQWAAVLVSQGTAQGSEAQWFWEGATVAFGGPPGGRGEAGRALRAVMRSAQPAGEGSGASHEKAALQGVLERAAAVAGAGFWEDWLGGASLRPALDTEAEAEGSPVTYAAPPSATAVWRARAASGP